jgi:hypothetical protein
VDDATLREALVQQGFGAPSVDLLIAREHATEARENERITNTVLELTGAHPRTLAQFVHEYRGKFCKAGTG